MSMKTVLVLASLILLTIPWVPTGTAQVGIVDVSVSMVRTTLDPVANVSTSIIAVVNTTGPATVRVDFTYGDGTPVRDGDVPGMSSFLVRTMDGPKTEEFELKGYTPSWDRRGFQQIVVTAQVQGQADADPSNNTGVLNTFIRVPALNLTFEDPITPEVLPQGESLLRYFVRNDGNFPENATPEFQLDAGPWAVRSFGPLPTIPPGGSATGIVLVRSTASTTDARNLSLNLTIRSGVGGAGDARGQTPSLHANESVFSRRPTAAFEGLPPNVQIFAGEERSIPFILRNTGDVDRVFRVVPSILHAPIGWNASMRVPPGWQANLTTPANITEHFPVALRPNESMALLVNVTRALDAPNATATLRFEVNSTDGDRIAVLVGGSFRSEATLSLADSGPDLTLAVIAAPRTVYQGEAPGYRVEVRNVGRVNATNASLHMELRDNLRAVEEATFAVPTLGPGNATILAWAPDTLSLRGPYVLLARVDANASQIDRNPANNTARETLDVRAPVLSVRAPEQVQAIPGTRLQFGTSQGGLSVANLGASEEAVLVRMDSAVPWARTEWRVVLPPGGQHVLELDLEVPTIPGVDRAAVTLTAVIEGRARFSATTSFVIAVDDVDRPALTLVSPLDPTKVANETRIAIRAVDSSGIGRAEVLMLIPSGERVLLPLQREAAEPDVFATRHTPYAPGEYRLEFRVEDSSRRIEGVSYLNATWRVDGSSYAGLKPVNFGEDAHVGRVPLRFAEVKAGTTKSVLADVGDGLKLLPPPYEIVLPLLEGPRLLVLRATATDGSLWEGRWNVIVDHTPPQLAEPASKTVGEGRVELTVRAEGAQNVTARFQTGTGPIVVPLTARGNGLFGATVTAPGSWDTITFVAADQAGNEGSATLDAPKAETPFVGPLALFAVLGMLAMALRRRS